MVLAWTADLNTGIEVIDNQHHRILDYINELEVMAQNDRQGLGQILEALEDYTLTHFAFEESLQGEIKYKHCDMHKAMHETFAKRIARYRAKHRSGEDVAEQLHAMLSSWLMQHIKRDDRAFVAEVLVRQQTPEVRQTQQTWISRTMDRLFH